MADDAPVAALVDELAGLITYGTSSDGLRGCLTIMHLPLVERAGRAGADEDHATRVFLEQVARRARAAGRNDVVVAAALTGVDPRDDIRPTKNQGGADRRRQTAAPLAECEPATLRSRRTRDTYLGAFARAILEFSRETEGHEGIARSYLEACGVKEAPLTNLAASRGTNEEARAATQLSLASSQLVPLAGVLRAALESARSQCLAKGRAFYTTDELLALLSLPHGAARAVLDRVEPGLSVKTTTRVRDFVAALDSKAAHPYVPFDWVERPDIQRAQQLALEDGTGVATDLHLLLALLEGDTGTLSALRDVWTDLPAIHQAARVHQASAPSVIRTPLVADAMPHHE